MGFRLAPGSCSESLGNSGLGQQGGAARGSEGFRCVQETARSAVSCTGLRGASREIAPSSMGTAASARNPTLNSFKIRAILKEPPQGHTGDGLPIKRRVGTPKEVIYEHLEDEK